MLLLTLEDATTEFCARKKCSVLSWILKVVSCVENHCGPGSRFLNFQSCGFNWVSFTFTGSIVKIVEKINQVRLVGETSTRIIFYEQASNTYFFSACLYI